MGKCFLSYRTQKRGSRSGKLLKGSKLMLPRGNVVLVSKRDELPWSRRHDMGVGEPARILDTHSRSAR